EGPSCCVRRRETGGKGGDESRHACDQVHVQTVSRRRSAAGSNYCPSCAFSYQWFSKLAIREGSFENPFHSRRKIPLFRRGLLLFAIGCDAFNRSCEPEGLRQV